MAKYLVVQFDNDAEADAFAATIQATEGTIAIAGIFKKPTQFCDCSGELKFKRGEQWGWWIHPACGRARNGQWQSPRNLLDPPDILAKDRKSFMQFKDDHPVGINMVEGTS